MASEQTLTPNAFPTPPATGGPVDSRTAEPEFQAATQQSGKDEGLLEPGEIPSSEIKQEEGTAHDTPLNPFLLVSNKHKNPIVSPFAHLPITPSPAMPFGRPGSQGSPGDIPQSATAIQRRNHTRVSDIVTRLQNFDGSVTELLAIASVQQQLDAAFDDLDHAKYQLKGVFEQFELQGQLSQRQCQKANGAAKDLARTSQHITQLTKKLGDLQRRKPGAH
ncbi:hypothetical protein F5Y10DRAFT_178485 [Nemania abortiva]|nr:hypothetical protein F5Y10DRAFT_178485 [Nemania abortiva]